MPANCFAIGLLSLRHPELYTVMLTIRDVTCRATTTAPVTTAAAPATATAITTRTRESHPIHLQGTVSRLDSHLQRSG